MRNILILALSCIVAFFLLAYRLTSVPPGINGDEAGIAHNAVLISRNLTDENDNFLPLFIFAKDSDWKQPITVYATSLVFKIFGVTFMNLRVTSILFVVVSIIFLYLISKEKYDLKFFVLSSLIFLTVPIILIQSHLALENIAPLPFILFWLWSLAKYEKTRKNIFLTLSGMSLGASLFSYLGMRAVSPALIVVTLVFLYKMRGKIVYFLLGALPFYLLLWVSNYYYPGAVFGHFSTSTPSINDFLLRYLSVFDLSFLFLKGDITPYHSTGQAGMFLVSTLPLFIFGMWKVIERKKSFEILLLWSFFTSPLLLGLVPDIYRASRLLAIVPFFVLIASLGLASVGKRMTVLIILLVLINFGYFAGDYWFPYPKRVQDSFPKTMENYNYDFSEKGK